MELGHDELLELGGQPGFDEWPGGSDGKGTQQTAPAAAGFRSGGGTPKQECDSERGGQDPTQPSRRVAAQGIEDAAGHVQPLPDGGGLFAELAAGCFA